MVSSHFDIIEEKMKRAGQPQIAIDNYRHYYSLVESNQTGFIYEDTIVPVNDLPHADDLGKDADLLAVGEAALSETVIMKLNGGLGTSMGLISPKSTLMVRDGYTFLDIVAKQVELAQMPLIFMTSYSTRQDTLDAISQYPHLVRNDMPQDFIQHKVPKIRQDNLAPVVWDTHPELEWCPPGHGDIYIALVTSGMLDTLLSLGYQYIFSSNSDNLGAVVDRGILGHFVKNKLSFLMEVVERSKADRKGGHLAQYHDGRYLLREATLCPDVDRETFEDITRYKYFNINNLWINLADLKQTLQEKDYLPRLPMITNRKRVDPRNTESTPVLQLETAMGSGIEMFWNAGAVCVPRSRFSPVKTTDDLLLVRSDAYQLTDDYRIIIDPSLSEPPFVHLDDRYYKIIDDFEARFPGGPPSLIGCRSLTVEGDFHFGDNVTLQGNVKLENCAEKPKALSHQVISM